MQTIARPSPNHDSREGAPIDMLVLHYTGMQTAQGALERLCDPVAKVSAHYTVDEDGTVYAHVPEERRAWHAGLSHWAGVSNVNARSIGIEIVNPGHEYGYRAFPQAQIQSVITLCHGILSRHAITPSRVLGHSDVAPMRKEDPGELFPWADLARAGIGVWPKRTESDLGPDALARYGYDPAAPQDKLITAFQRHFRPEKLDGLWDRECGGLLSHLISQNEMDHWAQVRRDLKIEIIAPFEVMLDDGSQFKVSALVKKFGARQGMLVHSDFEVLRPYRSQILEAGYGYSCWQISSEYDRISMIEVLKDWGWSGSPDEKPNWLGD